MGALINPSIKKNIMKQRNNHFHNIRTGLGMDDIVDVDDDGDCDNVDDGDRDLPVMFIAVVR